MKIARLSLVIIALAILLGAFFAYSLVQISREAGEENGMTNSFASEKDLESLLPEAAVGPVTQTLTDLNGDGQDELVIGFSVTDRQGIEERLAPRLRRFEKSAGQWKLESEFSFPFIDPLSSGLPPLILEGTPSFEIKDIDGDGREELFVRLSVNQTFYRGTAVVVGQSGALAWLPLVDEKETRRLPIFLEGGNAFTQRRLIVEDADGGGGLELIAADGAIDQGSGMARWQYEVYARRGEVYRLDPVLTALYTNSGRSPQE